MNVKVIYKKIKYLHLRVKNNEVIVSAPYLTSKKYIETFVINNKEFIEKQLSQQKLVEDAKTIKINDKLSILNNEYEVLSTSLNPKITSHYIFVLENEDIRKQIKKLFKKQLFEYTYNLTLMYYIMMNLKCPIPKITIKDVKSKWGSYCKSKHEIVYASELIFKDMEVIDYIVVHELAHILQFNHSKEFYDIVSQYCPNYKYLKQKLKEL